MLRKLQESDIKLLNIFRTVVRCGGFAAAQVDLNTSQSAISTAISDLEVRLGQRLCERGRAGFRLTQEGQITLEAFEKVFHAIKDCTDELNDRFARISGDLSVGINDNLVTHPEMKLPDAIWRFQKLAPDVDMRLYIGAVTELESKCLDGTLHLAIGYFPKQVSALEYSSFSAETHQLYCSNKNPLFGKSDAELADADLSIEKYVSRGMLMDPDGFSGGEIGEGGFKSRAESLNMEGLLLLVLSGSYIAYLPDHYAQRWVSEGKIRALLPGKYGRTYEFSIVTCRGQTITRAAAMFIEELKLVAGIVPKYS